MSDTVTLIVKTITQAPIFLSLVTLVGLLLQHKKPHEILDGVVKTLAYEHLNPSDSKVERGHGRAGRRASELLRLRDDAF